MTNILLILLQACYPFYSLIAEDRFQVLGFGFATSSSNT
ncbi:hypothetical protein D1BOALGB6SA_6238 [Olavius sp. associated proteobacterium Delta 1]|nr:hypothetical protein D1BOALGB6SA_6238 [Olavius sp. associated proteobacterium Delta 1]